MKMAVPFKAPPVWIQTGQERSQYFGFMFTRIGDPFALALTGGCGYMSPEDAWKRAILKTVFRGFAGTALFGGTRMLYRNDPSVIVPGITEVFPAIRDYCPKAKLLGIAAKSQTFKASPYGLVISDNPNDDYFTVIHPEQDGMVILQPGVDAVSKSPWDDEWKERCNIVAELQKGGWGSGLVVFNGGSITEKELLCWAENGRRELEAFGQTAWNVILVNGSGRKADEYANNAVFLQANGSVHVVEMSVESIRGKLVQIGALCAENAT